MVGGPGDRPEHPDPLGTPGEEVEHAERDGGLAGLALGRGDVDAPGRVVVAGLAVGLDVARGVGPAVRRRARPRGGRRGRGGPGRCRAGRLRQGGDRLGGRAHSLSPPVAAVPPVWPANAGPADSVPVSPASGHTQSRTSGMSSPCPRVQCPRADPGVVHALAQTRGLRPQVRDPVDDVDDEVVPVEVVEHDHVERRRRRALLLVAAHVDVRVARAAVGEAVDEPRVAVVGEDDRPVGGEQGVELAVGQAVRVLRWRPAAASGRRR